MPFSSSSFFSQQRLGRARSAFAALCGRAAESVVSVPRSDVANELHRAVERSRSVLGELDAAPAIKRFVRRPRSFALLRWVRRRTHVTLALPDTRALATVLGFAVVAPLAMFTAFGVWYHLHDTDAGPDAPQRLAVMRDVPAPAPSTAPSIAPMVAAVFAAPVAVAPAAAAPAAADPAPAAPAARIATAAMPVQVHATAIAPRATRSNPEPAPRVARVARDPLSACDGRNFFASAICVNNVCASAAGAGSQRCIVAVQQRHIDEQRRNQPVLN